MKSTLKTFLFVIVLSLLSQNTNAQFGAMPPFSIHIEPISGINIPGLHSFAFAQSGDKWLFVGGRTNGLHGLNSNDGFDPSYNNNSIFVVDTSSWQFYSADLNQLPIPVADPLRSTNMEYYQEGNRLYMIGGYGFDSITQDFTTFSKLTAINVDSMIYAVMNALPIAPYLRQIADTNFAVSGGEMTKLGNDYYLIFGHNFFGRYDHDPDSPLFTQIYSNRIKKFTINDNGTTISLSPFTYQTDTTNFHRRDLTVAPIVKPGGGFGVGAYGGVFQKHIDLPYLEPITIDASGAVVNMSYHQLMSQYNCAAMPIYDSVTQAMYTTFFGGISLNNYNPVTSVLTRDTLVPFIQNITTMSVLANGSTSEAVMPVQFNERLGANAKFIRSGQVSQYANDVIKFRNLPNTQTLVGYMFGGIRANTGNFGITTANDSIYRIYITPQFNVGIAERNENVVNSTLYPNPSSQAATLFFSVKKEDAVRISLMDITGKEVQLIADERMPAGNRQMTINTSKLSPGVYICKIGNEHLSLVVQR